MNFHWFPEIVQFLLSFWWINDFLCVSFFFYNNCDFFKSFESWNVWCSICYFWNIFQRLSNEILMYYLHIIKFTNFKGTIKCLEEGLITTFNNHDTQNFHHPKSSIRPFAFMYFHTYIHIQIIDLLSLQFVCSNISYKWKVQVLSCLDSFILL